jgi:lantibiotic biosynthesis protein
MTSLTPFSKFVFRAPINTYNHVIALYEGNLTLAAILSDKTFQEAIYLSSAALYQIIFIENNQKESTIRSLYKYYIRYGSRCTPFGLFAGCGVGNIGDENKLEIDLQKIKRATRLDMDFLSELTTKIQKENQPLLLYKNNSTGYKIAQQFRFIEYSYVAGNRKHELSAIELNELIECVLAFTKNARTIAEIVKNIEAPFTKKQKYNFVKSLIDNQVLCSDIDPFATGMPFSDFLLQKSIHFSNTKGQSEVTSLLQSIQKIILEVDSGQASNNIESYEEIKHNIQASDQAFNPNYLLQSDVYFKDKTLSITNNLVKNALIGMDILSRFSKPKNDDLEAFKNAFNQRFDGRFVPLTEVLDEEIGIGFPAKAEFGISEASTLIDTLNYSPTAKKDTAPIGNFDLFWLEKYEKAIRDNSFEIILEKNDWAKLPSQMDKVSPTTSAMFSVFGEQQNPNILLKPVGCTTALNLLGRFSNSSPAINELASQIAAYEKAYYSDSIIAEIAHIPEKRVGNILMRPNFFDYEITYLSNSQLPENKQINIADLLVGVVENEIILYSKILEKRIIPRLSNAHNYFENSLPVYNFLCSIQHQGLLSLKLDLGEAFKQLIYTPRIRFQNTIFKLASWNFQQKYLADVKNFEAFLTFCQYWKLPKYIAIIDGDNELVIDTSTKLGYELLLESNSKSKTILLNEWLQFNNKFEIGGNNTNQIILPFYKNESSKSIRKSNFILPEITRNFEPGSNWLYLKLYGGTNISEAWLANLFQIIEKLGAENKLEKWFFIRYNDPHAHIRLRLKLTSGQFNGLVIEQIQQLINSNNLPIWKIQYDTYERELERYGHEAIENAEAIFHIDSQNYANILLNYPLLSDQMRWLACLYNVDFWLKHFFPDMNARLIFVEKSKESFAAEFSDDPALKQNLSNLYRNNKEVFEQIFVDNNLDSNFKKLEKLLSKNNKLIKQNISVLAKNEYLSLAQLASSCLHMHINRWHLASQRLHEYFVYDSLFKIYRTIIGQAKMQAKN